MFTISNSGVYKHPDLEPSEVSVKIFIDIRVLNQINSATLKSSKLISNVMVTNTSKHQIFLLFKLLIIIKKKPQVFRHWKIQ